MRLIRNRYENSLAYVDALMMRLTDALEASPLHRETVFAFVGDHGEEFREYGSLIHGSNLEDPQTVVPFVLRAPRLGSVHFGGVKSTLQLWPTLLDAAGLAYPPTLFHSVSALDDRDATVMVSKVRTDRFPKTFSLRHGQGNVEVNLALGVTGIMMDAQIRSGPLPQTAAQDTVPERLSLPDCVMPLPERGECLIRFARDEG